MRLTSCTAFFMMSYIDASYRFLFPLFINSEELIYCQFFEVPYLNSQTQFIITFTIEIGYCNLWAHLRVRYVVSIRNTVVLSGFYLTDCQISPFEVRINHFIFNGDG